MGFVVFVVLILGYWIFGDFWWLLWMPLTGIVLAIVWALLIELVEWSDSRKTCPVCRNWIRSVIMTDVGIERQQPLCTRHHKRRMRIWTLEQSMGLPLSGYEQLGRSTKRKKKGSEK